MKLFHGSQVANITTLQPFGEKPLVYFFSKRENCLVYLANAVERFCKQTGFEYNGKFATWGPYGFCDGILCWSEYYKDALKETFDGACGYIYSAETDTAKSYGSIPFAYVSDQPVPVTHCEFVPNVYQEILQMEQQGKLKIIRYEEMTPQRKRWLEKVITEQYNNPQIAPDYKYFLQNKFDFLK